MTEPAKIQRTCFACVKNYEGDYQCAGFSKMWCKEGFCKFYKTKAEVSNDTLRLVHEEAHRVSTPQ